MRPPTDIDLSTRSDMERTKMILHTILFLNFHIVFSTVPHHLNYICKSGSYQSISAWGIHQAIDFPEKCPIT